MAPVACDGAASDGAVVSQHASQHGQAVPHVGGHTDPQHAEAFEPLPLPQHTPTSMATDTMALAENRFMHIGVQSMVTLLRSLSERLMSLQ